VRLGRGLASVHNRWLTVQRVRKFCVVFGIAEGIAMVAYRVKKSVMRLRVYGIVM
jgi:hypothetical protein